MLSFFAIQIHPTKREVVTSSLEKTFTEKQNKQKKKPKTNKTNKTQLFFILSLPFPLCLSFSDVLVLSSSSSFQEKEANTFRFGNGCLFVSANQDHQHNQTFSFSAEITQPREPKTIILEKRKRLGDMGLH